MDQEPFPHPVSTVWAAEPIGPRRARRRRAEELTGRKYRPPRRRIRHGADELDLVRSGLDDTMRDAYQQIREVYRVHDDIPDLRTAAYRLAIERIARANMEMGV